MKQGLLSECTLLEDMFQPLLIISKTSIPKKALESLIEMCKSADGRYILAQKKVLLSALEICRNLSYASSSHLLLLTLKLIRNFCAGEQINQKLFLSHDGVGVVLSTLDAMGISLSKSVVIEMAIQVIANVSLAGEIQQADIWSRFFPTKFLELARVRSRETCEPLCMVIYTCCDENGLFGQLVGDRGLPLIEEIIRTASIVGVRENWFKLLISKISFKENHFPKLFSRFFSSDAAENDQDGNSIGATFCKEQAFLLSTLSNVKLYEISIPINFPSAILEILKQAVENINLSPKEERSSVPSANVIAYSLIMLRDICANQNESMNDVIISLLSSGLIELLASLLKDLEPPDMVKEAMKQSEDIAETSSKALEPALYNGFHRDIVSVIANCAFKRKCVQDEVRERNGIHLLLQHCVTDEDNPFLKEWGVFAMRNLLEGNMENQQCVAELKLQGCVEFPEISKSWNESGN